MTRILFFLLFSTALSGQIVPGSLDPTFGIDGGVRIHYNGYVNERAEGVAVQSDGKVLTINNVSRETGNNSDVILTRLNPSGSVNTSFGTLGHVKIGSDDLHETAYDILVQPDGKIMVLGTVSPQFNLGANADPFLTRLLPSGVLDTTFGSGGTVVLEGFSISCPRLHLLPDGKFLLASTNIGLGYTYFISLIRLMPDGSLDTSFGGTGEISHDLITETEYVSDVELQSDGKIVVLCAYENSALQKANYTLFRFLPNGELDNTFGDNGQVFSPIVENIVRTNALTILSNGGIVVGGRCRYITDYYHLFVVCYLPDGSLNTGFSENGWFYYEHDDESDEEIVGIEEQGDGKIIAGGSTYYGLALFRFHPNGVVDSTFGVNGISIYQHPTAADFPFEMIMHDDKIYLSGWAFQSVNTGGRRAFVTRFHRGPLVSSTHSLDATILQKMYPNPTRDYLILDLDLPQSESLYLDLVNSQGQIVQTWHFDDLPTGPNQLELSLDADLPAGMYTVHAQGRAAWQVALVRE